MHEFSLTHADTVNKDPKSAIYYFSIARSRTDQVYDRFNPQSAPMILGRLSYYDKSIQSMLVMRDRSYKKTDDIIF